MPLNVRNLAGIVRVLMLPKDDITAMPELNLARNETVGAVTTAGTWVELVFAKHSANYAEEPVTKDGVITWQVEVKGDLIEAERLAHNDLLKRVVVDITDANGVRLLLGTKEQPLSIGFKTDSGTPSNGRKNMMVISGDLSEQPPLYAP